MVPSNQKTLILSDSLPGQNVIGLVAFLSGYVNSSNYSSSSNSYFSFAKIFTKLNNEMKYTSLGNGTLGLSAFLDELCNIQIFTHINNVWEGNMYYFGNLYLWTAYIRVST